LADLEFFRGPLSNAMEYQSDLAEGETPPILLHARDIAVCAVKSHVLYEQQLHPGASAAPAALHNVLTDLVQQCEGAGLRLCGLRLVHLSALELFEYETHCSVPGYTKPCIPAEATPTALKADGHVLPVLCLAFHTVSCAAAEKAPAVTGLSSRGNSSLTSATAAILRSVLGPEDPALARKTDPTSLRAVYGTSKEHNLVYPVAHSADRLLKETTFWFGGRKSDVAESSASVKPAKSVTLLRISPARFVTVRWMLRAGCESLTSASAHQLSVAQSTVLSAVSGTFGVTGMMYSMSTESKSLADRRVSESYGEAESLDSVQQFSACYQTHVGDLYIAQTASMITERVNNLPGVGPWRVAFSFDVTDSLKAGITSGSRLLALEMLKRAPEDDCKSHEDVGLLDVVVLTIGNFPVLQPADGAVDSRVASRPSDSAAVVLPILVKVMSYFPKTCDAHVVAMRTNANVSGVVVAVRGYQVIENVEYAIAEMQRLYSGSNSPGNPATAKAAVTSGGGGIKKGTAEVKEAGSTADLEAKIASTVRHYKSRKGMEILFTELPLSGMYVDLALRDLYTYVPSPGTQSTADLSWQDRAAAISEASAQTGTGSAPSSTAGRAQYTSTQYLQALYPPGVFSAMAVLLVPWLDDSAEMTRNLAKIITRLEKERFSIVEIKVVTRISEALTKELYVENCQEYTANFRSSGSSTAEGTSPAWSADAVSAMLKAVSTRSTLAILVRRRSALLQLKSVVGPVFSMDMAEAQYPRSIVTLLDSLRSGGSVGAVASRYLAGQAPAPFVLPTLSCRSAQAAMQEIFPHFHASYDAQQAAVGLNHLSSDLHASAADSANIEHLVEADAGSGMVDGLPVRIPLVERVNKALPTGAHSSSSDSIELQQKTSAQPGTEPSSALSKSSDIAGVVLTHALLQEVGIGPILEALHREGLVVRFQMV
jgi:nucleoside diphosphate kinase